MVIDWHNDISRVIFCCMSNLRCELSPCGVRGGREGIRGGRTGGGGIEEGRKRWEGGIRENRGKGK